MVCQLLTRLYFAVTIYLISCALKQAEATVTITAPSSPPCFDGEPYKLTCTHPVLATSTLLWEKDGVFLSTTASATHQSVETTPTTTTLTITVTREEFENKVYTYRCYTADQVTNERVYSNNSITVDPPEPKNYNVILVGGGRKIACVWSRIDQDNMCFNESERLSTLNISIWNGDVLIFNTTNNQSGSDLMPMEMDLKPNTTYKVMYRAEFEYVSSEEMVQMVNTTEKTSITAEPEELMVNETFTLQCKFNNKFNMERIIWMKEEEMLNTAKPPNCTEDGIMVKCFILMTFTSSANYSCALPFPGIEEEMELSDEVLVQEKYPTVSYNEEYDINIIAAVIVPVVIILMAVVIVVIIVVCWRCFRKAIKPKDVDLSREIDHTQTRVTPMQLEDSKPRNITYAELTFQTEMSERKLVENDLYAVEYTSIQKRSLENF